MFLVVILCDSSANFIIRGTCESLLTGYLSSWLWVSFSCFLLYLVIFHLCCRQCSWLWILVSSSEEHWIWFQQTVSLDPTHGLDVLRLSSRLCSEMSIFIFLSYPLVLVCGLTVKVSPSGVAAKGSGWSPRPSISVGLEFLLHLPSTRQLQERLLNSGFRFLLSSGCIGVSLHTPTSGPGHRFWLS